MKRIIAFLIASIIFLPLSLNADVPNKKERRKARKEIKKQERAIKDSLLMLMEEADSVNAGYGYSDHYGLIDRNGKRITAPLYTGIEAIAEDLYLCQPDGIIINEQGKVIK